MHNSSIVSNYEVRTIHGIFNIFFILGASALIKPLPFTASSNVDIFMTIIASLLLFISTITLKRAKLDRLEGVVFILVYITYVVYLIVNI